MAKILIIEDDLAISSSIKSWLERDKHVVDSTASGKDGLELLLRFSYDLMILDWNLPDATGPEIATQVRAKQNLTPILMLTTNSSIEQKVHGLDSGACDYVAKPCTLEEIAARVRALLRRTGSKTQDESLQFEDIQIDAHARVASASGNKLKLSPSEFDILAFLVANQGKSFSPTAIVSRVWPNRASSKEAVHVHVRHLREKMAAAGCRSAITTNEAAEYILSISGS
jgi:DNA-binding response OmpR family regulator